MEKTGANMRRHRPMQSSVCIFRQCGREWLKMAGAALEEQPDV